ncbi:MAG: hypothetical protein ACOX4Q_05720 [Syntrophomonadales bacterium]
MKDQIYILPIYPAKRIQDLLNSMSLEGYQVLDISPYWRIHNPGCYNAKAEEDMVMISFHRAEGAYDYLYQLYPRSIEQSLKEMNALIIEKSAEGYDVFKTFFSHILRVDRSIPCIHSNAKILNLILRKQIV